MNKKILIVSILLIFSLFSITASAQNNGFIKASSLKPFENMMKEKVNLYELYKEGDLNIYNKSISIGKDETLTLNAILADKANVIIMYTLKGNSEYHEISISSKNFRSYLDENKTSAYSAGMQSFTDKENTYVILDCNVQLVPNYDNTIVLTIENDDNTFRELTIPFGDENFLRSSVDYSPNVQLEGFRDRVTLSRVVSSPLGLTLFSTYTEDPSNKNPHNLPREVDYKGSSLVTEDTELECFGGGGTRISDNIFLDYSSYSPIPRDTKEIYFYTNGKKYTIKLPIIPTVHHPKDAYELGSTIGSNRTIYLDDKEYNLSTILYETDVLQKNPVHDGKEIIIKNIENLTIIGKENSKIVVEPRYANVLTFENCKNIKLHNLTIGHTIEPGHCTGGVIKALNTTGLTIKNSKLFGCGTQGLELESSNDIKVLDSEIYECSYGIMAIRDSGNILFKNNTFHDNKEFYGVEITEGNNITFEDNKFYNNETSDDESLIHIYSGSNISFKDNIFENNKCRSIYN
ncbi:MAG: right-handed parallel beta-helix repeat-containing protein [Anaeromicrobium sp.]|jgi:parallel beta-helix repeat protein|uniref:right-handed parallel beta-helix repeat-containing protein n=1 Tax=Anaeromicrobium sp. TaxID=1929132 RepID=UPI0025EFD7B7|nr:right-handed parallel beta-helix repeat-containing protein [Anaeromicrobium sp.]MCT4593218.1 right-handed parallel beta-helix repeat-containing protein [Anaeromicrobium sp.]